MSKVRATIGTDGVQLPILPPERDARVWARLVRVMFYLPGFMALLLIKAGDSTSFGVTVELLMLSSACAIIAGLFIGTESCGAGADASSKAGTWSGSLVLELLAAVPFLCAVPGLFHELMQSRVLHPAGFVSANGDFGASEVLPMVAILPFLLYQLAGFGTLNYIVPRSVNWIINVGIAVLITAGYIANCEGEHSWEKSFACLLIFAMVLVVFYGVLKLRRMQETYDRHCPPKLKASDA